jgi:hypothetical protein
MITFPKLFKRRNLSEGIRGVIVTVPQSYLDTVRLNGSCIAGNVLIVPVDGKMERMLCKNGTVLIRGAGFVCESIIDSMKLCDTRSWPNFKWVDTAFFDELYMPVEASKEDVELCQSFDFLIYNGRKSADGWVVLESVMRDDEQPYAAGRIVNGKLFLIRDGMVLRVPEEASSFCLRNQLHADELPIKSGLFDLAEAIETNDFNLGLHDFKEAVYSGDFALHDLRVEGDHPKLELRPWPKDKRNEPYDL